MYEEKQMNACQPEHVVIALKMASEIIDRFNLLQQNECAKTILSRLITYRREQMEDHEHRIKEFAESINALSRDLSPNT